MTNQKRVRFKPPQEKTEFRYSVNFTASQHARFLTLFEESGVYSKSAFIKARVFDESFRVIKVDRSLIDRVSSSTFPKTQLNHPRYC